MYSQNNEEKIIKDYFGDTIGSLLDIGANDGLTFSNSLALIEMGWSAVLVEPSDTAFKKLKLRHYNNPRVVCVEAAISEYTGQAEFYESGSIFKSNDVALVSTFKQNEKEKWSSVANFNKTVVQSYTFKDFYDKYCEDKKFDFITIDAEGFDLEILNQIDLEAIGCRLLCIEWNGKQINEFNKIASRYRLSLTASNAENLIYVK